MKSIRSGARVAALLLVSAGSPAIAGEVIGNTYISEQDGVIEVPAEGWNIKDTETPGNVKLAEFTPKAAIDGYRPSLTINRLANPGGQIEPDWLLQQIRDGLVTQGAVVQPTETRRIAGKPVLVLQYSMTQGVGAANGLLYMMQGESSLYWASFASNVNAWERSRPMFDEVMEKVRY